MFQGEPLLPGILGAQVPLFDHRVLQRYLEERGDDGLGGVAERIDAWLTDLRNTGNSSAERTLEQSFNQRIMLEVLGYKIYPEAPSSLWVKPLTEFTGLSGVPDAVLGAFDSGQNLTEFRGVLELKTPGTGLDRPQPRQRALTPVEQAFEYGTRLLGVRWILVTDMRIMRLYSVESAAMFESIDLSDCRVVNGTPTSALRRLRHLFHRDALIDGGDHSPAAQLLFKSASRKQAIETSFYEIYFKIRSTLLEAVESACSQANLVASKDDILSAVQRLLDRMLFLAYCQDHPDALIPRGTVKGVVDAASRLPGPNPHKVYDHLKALFREVDTGSSQASGIALSAYNGELFKFHPIVDVIDLPDTLSHQSFEANMRDGTRRVVRGVWGFEGYDFWRELDEHLLGSLFEQSLSDAVALRSGSPITLAQRLAERRRHGIYYTHAILAEYSVEGTLRSSLGVEGFPERREDQADFIKRQLDLLVGQRAFDPACGSGAFLVAAYRAFLSQWSRFRETLQHLQSTRAISPQLDFSSVERGVTQAALLRNSLYGADLLPQAVEIAKLALWLRSARKSEKVADLGGNIVVADSLRLQELLTSLHADRGSFDIVLGNPPWGGELDSKVYDRFLEQLEVDPPAQLDSWEVFVLLGLQLLKRGGRLAFILPDTIFAPEKAWIRGYLATHTTFERVVNLGMKWFSDRVRMGAVAFQLKLVPPNRDSTFVGFALTGKTRTSAIAGKILLTQIEADRGKKISQQLVVNRADHQIMVNVGIRDDEIMTKMETNGIKLPQLCSWARGEELSGTGTLWRCIGCGAHTVPPDARIGATSKECPNCKAILTSDDCQVIEAILPLQRRERGTISFLDTEDAHRRYSIANPSKHIVMGLLGFPYKDAKDFVAPKLVIREAGIGITAALDNTSARCARSMYAYRLKPEAIAKGYKLEYILAVLQSRTMHYYLVALTNQGDPRRPFANIRINTVNKLPLPRIDFHNDDQRLAHQEIVSLMDSIFAGAPSGGPEDLRIEALLRSLWGLSGDDGVYIARELSKLPQYGLLAQMSTPEVATARARQRRRASSIRATIVE